jgi:hypothetical protein
MQLRGERLFKELLEVQQEIRYLTSIAKDLSEVRERLIIDLNNENENLCESLRLINEKLENINCRYEKALFLERRLEMKLELIV